MSSLSLLWNIATSWYVSLVVFTAVGVVIGYFVFFDLWPEKPKVGVIDIPFTVINDDSAFVISAFLEYAREKDDIKAVMIRLNSPGGGAAASEQLFAAMVKLREKKPVVISMGDVVASGGYLMSLGANHTFAKTSSFVGNVGVILDRPGPSLPNLPDENLVSTGPFKLGGGARRDFIAVLDQMKESFAQLVVAQRGDRLRISVNELTEGRVYSGAQGLRLGLVDEIGGDGQAIEKAASLAGISGYDLVDVNTEVSRIFLEKIKRIIEPLEGLGASPLQASLGSLWPQPVGTGDLASGAGWANGLSLLKRFLIPSGIGESQQVVLPGFPLEINPPRFYYLYVGPGSQ